MELKGGERAKGQTMRDKGELLIEPIVGIKSIDFESINICYNLRFFLR